MNRGDPLCCAVALAFSLTLRAPQSLGGFPEGRALCSLGKESPQHCLVCPYFSDSQINIHGSRKDFCGLRPVSIPSSHSSLALTSIPASFSRRQAVLVSLEMLSFPDCHFCVNLSDHNIPPVVSPAQGVCCWTQRDPASRDPICSLFHHLLHSLDSMARTTQHLAFIPPFS